MNPIKLELAGMKGEVELKLFSEDGILKDYRFRHNLTVTVGYNAISRQMGDNNSQPVPFQYSAIGTGGGAAALGDTTLTTESGRLVGEFAVTGNTVWTNATTFAAGVATGAITEAGMFNGSPAGTMLCRQTFAVINKGSGDTLVVTWQYTLSAA